MKQLLATSTALQPIGYGFQRKLLKVQSGPYAGRLVAIFQTNPTTIGYSAADSPYSNWSSVVSIVTDAHDSSFDAQIDANGNIHVVYTAGSSRDLVTRKLTFSDGNWSAGSLVTIFDADQNYEPSLGIDSSGRLWVSWSRLIVPNRTLYVKSSNDSGATWGSGASDAGESMGVTGITTFGRLVVGLNAIHLIYTDGALVFGHRYKNLPSGDWSDPLTIHGAGSVGAQFDAAIAADGRLGVVFVTTQLLYREFDGFTWGGTSVLDSQSCVSPQLQYVNSIPFVTFLKPWEGEQAILMRVDRTSGQFGEALPLDSHAKEFDSVILFDQSAGSYANRTGEASSATNADVKHPVSGGLLDQVGDILYLGMIDRFRFVQLTLSTPGVGGTIGFSYWDGTGWRGFTPASGTSQLDNGNEKIWLWQDYNSIPSDWQKNLVNSISRFWVRLHVNSSFSTLPIASRVSSISELSTIVARR